MERLINIGLVIASTAFSLFTADVILKALKLPNEYSSIMLLSGSTLSTDDQGVRRYEPNKIVEQAALINAKLVYRYKYRTNNLGFVSKYDYQPNATLDLMIVGDSVTEGQEVGPWIDEIQKQLWERNGKTSQNLAIAGNGFIEFERAAVYAKNSLNAKKAIIIFIADDMFRPGDTMVADKDCSTYQNYIYPDVINCFSGRPTWHNYDSSLSDPELASYANSLQRFGLSQFLRRPTIKAGTQLVRWFCKTGIRVDSMLSIVRRINSECDANPSDEPAQGVQPVQVAKAPVLNQNAKGDALNQSTEAAKSDHRVKGPSLDQGAMIPAYTVIALEKVLRQYGVENVLLVMIPGGGNSFQAIRPQDFFAMKIGKEFDSPIRFVDISESCSMPQELWGRNGGGHPTAEGYQKLQSCVFASKEFIQFATQ